jgi:hypothetical protein
LERNRTQLFNVTLCLFHAAASLCRFRKIRPGKFRKI